MEIEQIVCLLRIPMNNITEIAVGRLLIRSHMHSMIVFNYIAHEYTLIICITCLYLKQKWLYYYSLPKALLACTTCLALVDFT